MHVLYKWAVCLLAAITIGGCTSDSNSASPAEPENTVSANSAEATAPVVKLHYWNFSASSGSYFPVQTWTLPDEDRLDWIREHYPQRFGPDTAYWYDYPPRLAPLVHVVGFVDQCFEVYDYGKIVYVPATIRPLDANGDPRLVFSTEAIRGRGEIEKCESQYGATVKLPSGEVVLALPATCSYLLREAEEGEAQQDEIVIIFNRLRHAPEDPFDQEFRGSPPTFQVSEIEEMTDGTMWKIEKDGARRKIYP